MSLEEYQNAYTELIFEREKREQWHNKKYQGREGLSEAELSALNAFPEDKIDHVFGGTFNGRKFVFQHSIPAIITSFINDNYLDKFSSEFIVKYPEADLFPKQKWLPFLLNALLEKIKTDISELPRHLEDIIKHESTRLSLNYYRIPIPVLPEGPVLSTWAGLFTAGPHIEEVIDKLYSKQTADDLSDTPKHGYLFLRKPDGDEIEKLHWTVFEILSLCDGTKSWEYMVEELINREELHDQKENLMKWEKHFIKEGILLQGQPGK